MSSLVDEDDLKDALAVYQSSLVKEYSLLMRKKFGLLKVVDEDNTLINDFLQLLYTQKRDYHRSMRQLSDQKERSMGSEFDTWFKRYHKRIKQEIEKPEQRQQLMNSVNPKYVLRNYLAEVAIRKAEDLNQYDEIETLFNC